ncbi:MAG: hypothetical protein C4K48_07110 [Candidatus Thorarchaeota archaeon]|nr:MAG: hypothetical protein C4K48_07110 [Candidatus Thorarchaeota archaeon]
MAEQFLNRLNKMDESIHQLGETLKRMITILGTVTEIKSEVRAAKEDIIRALASKPAAAPIEHDHTDELAKMVVQEVGDVRVFVQQSMESLKNDMVELLQVMIANVERVQITAPSAPSKPSASAAPRRAPAPEYVESEDQVSSSLPADRSMKIGEELTGILSSLKMGCVSGDVLDAMALAKDSIMSTVPSDPIMVKIDKWIGLVSNYPRRNELQARDLVKLKKELKEEIQRYSLA